MAKEDGIFIACADLGTLSKRNSTLQVLPNGQIVRGAEEWGDNVPETLTLARGPVNCWENGVLHSNLAHADLGTEKYDAFAVTGLSGSGLMVVDKNTGEPQIGFYGKPMLSADMTDPETIARHKKANIPENADPTYMWGKGLELLKIWPEIAALIGSKLNLEDIGIEPMVTAYARMLADLPFGAIGFGPHEYKGASGIPKATADQARQALSGMGWDDTQFAITEGLYTPIPNHNVYVSGDFPELLGHILGAMEKGVFGKDIIFVELDSNFKIYTWDEDQLTSLARYNDMGFPYGVNRNGAGINAIIEKFILPKTEGEKGWYLRADQLAGSELDSLEKNHNPYFYMPASKVDDLGALYKMESGIPRYIKFDELEKNGPDSALIISAMYAGVAAELRLKLEKLKAETKKGKVALHGGFVKMSDQIAKRIILSGMLSDFDVSLLDMPDSSTLAGISAASHIQRVNVNYHDMMTMNKLDKAKSLKQYYKKWKDLRDKLIS